MGMFVQRLSQAQELYLSISRIWFWLTIAIE